MTLRRTAAFGMTPAHPILSLIFLLFTLCFVSGIPAARAQLSAPFHLARYRNVVNRKFATVSNGPQSALILDAPAGATTGDEQTLALNAARASWRAQSRTLSKQIALLTQRGVLRAHGVIPISTIVGIRRNGVLVTPDTLGTRAAGAVTRVAGGGTLTFTYTGFDATDQSLLQNVVSVAYPAIVQIYGQPAQSANIEIVNAGDLDSSTITDVQRIAYGSYNVSTNQILLPVFDDSEATFSALILNMIHAFHGPLILQYDAWEQGFARAAAAIVARQTATTIGITDPSQSNLFDLLPYYDLLNQPALSNETFFPPSQANLALDSQATIGAMLLPRLGMSGAAWLKVFTENPNFFSAFNAAYYAQYDASASPTLAGNVPSLSAIAASLLPNGVEGTAWTTWMQQQYILDTSASVGDQLYEFVIPGILDTTTTTGGQASSIDLVYYQGLGTGDETLLPTSGSANAYASYFDSTNAQITPDESGAAEQASITNGEGSLTLFLLPTSGSETGRYTINVAIGNATAVSYLPSGFTGNFQGVVLGANATGNVTVTENSVQPSSSSGSGTGTLTGSAFSVVLSSGTATTAAYDLGAATVQITNGTTTTSYRVNIGDGQYYAVIHNGAGGGGTITATTTLTTDDVPYLVSFPVTPLSPIVDTALGLNGADFVLSYWDTAQSVYETATPGVASITPLQAGRGYWLKLEPSNATTPTMQTITITGVSPSNDTNFAIACPYGWNLIGSPYATPIDIADIEVQHGPFDVRAYDDAITASWVAAQPFSWDPTSMAYTATTTVDGTNWTGYWLQVLIPDGITLLLPAPDAPSSSSETRSTHVSRAVSRSVKATRLPPVEWTVHLHATQASALVPTRSGTTRLMKTSAAFGAGSSVHTSGFDNRYDVEAPPAIVPALTMSFPHKEWADRAGTGNFATDYRAAATTGAAWNVAVATPNAGAVTLSWDGVASMAQTTQLTLIDAATGTRTILRNRSSYTFTATAGQTRSFQIVAAEGRSLPFAIRNIMSVSTRAAGARGVSLSYLVTSGANITVQFSALTGRVVRHMATTRAEGSTLQTLHWDGRGDRGEAFPPGLYRMDISAQPDDGTPAHDSRPIMLLQ